MTFAEMRAAMERQQKEMQEKTKEEQAKHPENQDANVKITPKFIGERPERPKPSWPPTKELKWRDRNGDGVRLTRMRRRSSSRLASDDDPELGSVDRPVMCPATRDSAVLHSRWRKSWIGCPDR